MVATVKLDHGRSGNIHRLVPHPRYVVEPNTINVIWPHQVNLKSINAHLLDFRALQSIDAVTAGNPPNDDEIPRVCQVFEESRLVASRQKKNDLSAIHLLYAEKPAGGR